MATGQLNGMIQHLRRTALAQGDDGLTDGQLLDAFLLNADEAAFEALVHRHAPMVWGVCVRALGHSHDAEDAFQATFLVLVRRADAIRPREMVGNWLYGVACRTALKAKAAADKRKAREKQVAELPAKEVRDEQVWHDLRPLLDCELNRLADKYRVPVVLCDLEGKSQREAARQLGWPEGTLMTRLSRARQMLAKRLNRQGLMLSAGGLALMLSQNEASACAPAPLMVSTLKAATLVAAGQTASAAASASVAALTEGVLHAMLLTKVKTGILIALTIAFLATGGGIVTHQVLAGRAPIMEPAPLVQDDFAEEFTLLQERRPVAEPPSLYGRVIAVAKDGKAFTVESPAINRGDEPVKHEIKLTDKTKVAFYAVGADGARLKEGLGVQVWLSEGSKENAASVNFQGSVQTRRTPDVVGKVTSVSKDGSTVTLETQTRNRNDAGKTVDVKIVLRTMLTYSNVSSGGAKPTEGQNAAVWFEKNSKDTADTIHFNVAGPGERGRVVPRGDAAGRIVGVSTDAKTITIEIPPANRGDEATKADFKIDAKTKVTYFNIGPNGDRPAEGYFARVTLAEGSKDTVAALDLSDTPKDRHTILRSKVASVAKDGKSFTIEIPPTERGGEVKVVNVTITEHTRVAYMGVGLNGARPTEGYNAEVWLEEGSMTDAHQVILGAGGSEGRR